MCDQDHIEELQAAVNKTSAELVELQDEQKQLTAQLQACYPLLQRKR